MNFKLTKHMLVSSVYKKVRSTIQRSACTKRNENYDIMGAIYQSSILQIILTMMCDHVHTVSNSKTG